MEARNDYQLCAWHGLVRNCPDRIVSSDASGVTGHATPRVSWEQKLFEVENLFDTCCESTTFEMCLEMYVSNV